MSEIISPNVFGQSIIIDRPLGVQLYYDVVVIPHGIPGVPAGVYEIDGSVIRSATLFWGYPDLHPVYSSHTIHPDHFKDAEYSDLDEVLFGGQFIPHYGHFLLSTLPRFWSFSDRDRTHKIITINSEAEGVASMGTAARSLLAAAGPSANQFITVSRPTRFKKMIIPEASFEECNKAHRAFGDMCHKIAETMTGGVDNCASDEVIYVSKHKLQGGVSTVMNENDLCRILENNGIAIFHPQEHSIENQIRKFRGAKIIMGQIGSGLHNSVFANNKKIIGYSAGRNVLSNQKMIDMICNHDARYISMEHCSEEHEPSPAFQIRSSFRNTREVADLLLGEI